MTSATPPKPTLGAGGQRFKSSRPNHSPSLTYNTSRHAALLASECHGFRVTHVDSRFGRRGDFRCPKQSARAARQPAAHPGDAARSPVDVFGWTQNAGMGWDPASLGAKEFLLLSTHGGVRAPDGTPVALGYHTGHWEIGLLVEVAAKRLKAAGAVPFAAACSDPCDGRTQGTTGMFDSLPYRNDAAIVFRRLIRSLPQRRGVIGVATCDKGLPAMMMALAGMRDLPCVLVPGGVTLPPTDGEDAGKVQTIGARFAHGQITLREAAELGCRACASPGGGCQFLGTAATSQVVGEALGLAVMHSALAPSGQLIWLEMGRRSARALMEMMKQGLTTGLLLTDD